MQSTYFASFLLGEGRGDGIPSLAEAVEVVGDWIFENPYRQLSRPASWPSLAEPAVFPSGEKIQLLRLHDDQNRLHTSAIRYEHSDQQSRLWRTDCVLTEVSSPEPGLRFAVSVAAGGATEHLYAVNPPSSRPRVVRSMMEKFGGREGLPTQNDLP
jgi:hypothetical protein